MCDFSRRHPKYRTAAWVTVEDLQVFILMHLHHTDRLRQGVRAVLVSAAVRDWAGRHGQHVHPQHLAKAVRGLRDLGRLEQTGRGGAIAYTLR